MPPLPDRDRTASIPRARVLAGFAVALVGGALATAVMVPVRTHLPAATPALVLLVPVVAGVVVGGLPVAATGVVLGTLVYTYFFKAPYDSFRIAAADWVDAAVYVLVGLVVARLVSHARRLQLQATRAELLEQVDAFRGALLRSVSHDLRTPLASVKAAVSDLRDPSVALADTDRCDLLTMIDSQTERLIALVTNLLDMSRIEGGALVPHAQPIGVSELVEDVVERLGPAPHGQQVRVAVDGDLVVQADYPLTVQVLLNLLGNALTHGRSDGGVDVVARRAATGVEIAVVDHGAGIRAAARDTVFEPFTAADGAGGTVAPGGGGSGLGLAICRSFAEVQGGVIELSETVDGGCTVTLRLPLAAGLESARLDDTTEARPVPDAGPAHDAQPDGGR